MPVGGVREYDQVIGGGPHARTIPKLVKAAARIQTTIGENVFKKIFRVTHHIRQIVPFRLVIEPFDELDALPLLPEVVTIAAVIFPVTAEKQKSIVVNGHAAIAVQNSADAEAVQKNQQNCHCCQYQ